MEELPGKGQSELHTQWSEGGTGEPPLYLIDPYYYTTSTPHTTTSTPSYSTLHYITPTIPTWDIGKIIPPSPVAELTYHLVRELYSKITPESDRLTLYYRLERADVRKLIIHDLLVSDEALKKIVLEEQDTDCVAAAIEKIMDEGFLALHISNPDIPLIVKGALQFRLEVLASLKKNQEGTV